MGDITQLIPDEDADVCVLEEPEHLNWYKAPFTAKAWMDKFKHVVGIIHTNYLSYTRSYPLGQVKEPLLYYVNQGVCRAYCHKIIKLSAALQEFAVEKEVVSNVHGVRSKYLKIGDAAAAGKFTKGAYFVGKLAWAKGLAELFNLMVCGLRYAVCGMCMGAIGS
jgi:digalactosyldiacylglycerol synthase